MVRCTYTGFLGVAGVPTMVRAGDVFPLDHAVVKAHPRLFVEIVEAAPPAAEPASLEPVAKRPRPRPKRTSDE